MIGCIGIHSIGNYTYYRSNFECVQYPYKSAYIGQPLALACFSSVEYSFSVRNWLYCLSPGLRFSYLLFEVPLRNFPNMMKGLAKTIVYIIAGIHQYPLAAKQLKITPVINSKSPTIKIIQAMILLPSSNHKKLSNIKISEKLDICNAGVCLISDFVANSIKATAIIMVPYIRTTLLNSLLVFHHLRDWNKKIIPIPIMGSVGAISVSPFINSVSQFINSAIFVTSIFEAIPNC